MKLGLTTSYLTGIKKVTHGISYSALMKYVWPEFINALLLYSVPIWLEAYWISMLSSTPMYAALGSTNNMIHFLVKVAEAFGVGTIILSGQYNGVGEFEEAGKSLRDAFWVTMILGGSLAFFLYFGAYAIFHWHGLSPEIIELGIPFLRVRAISVLFMFIYFAFTGFMRGIKNTKTPMHIFVAGVLVFIFFDYACIFGKWGFPAMGLQGSAVASAVQYGLMVVLAIIYIACAPENRKYQIYLFAPLKSGSHMWRLIKLSMPVVVDKAILAFAHIWLCKMIGTMGTVGGAGLSACGVAAFCTIHNMQRFAFLPALASAQVITFLVSNDYINGNWLAIKENIKKLLFIPAVGMLITVIAYLLWPRFFISLFDKKGDFTNFAVAVFPYITLLSFLDLPQLILSAALRGSGNVLLVMMVRLGVVFCFFVPVTYGITLLPLTDYKMQFLLVYSMYYVGNILMGVIYIRAFRNDSWKQVSN